MRSHLPTFRLATLALLTLAFFAPQVAQAQFVRPKKARKIVTPKPVPQAPKKPAEKTPAPATADSLESRIALQLALERACFSPGIIDGLIGPKTRSALSAFQSSRELSPTGELNDETAALLKLDAAAPTRAYTLTNADASRVGPCPTDWLERSQAERLPFRSLLEVAAFEGHCTHALIAKLNPKLDIHALAVGQTITLPNVAKSLECPRIARIRIEFEHKQVQGLDEEGRLVALFHCSIARQRDDRPQGECIVQSIAENPEYTFRPESWPEVKGIDHVLQIPPGPRNPVGLCWIDLSINGYGIHGTPDPELIGKTGSHGCIRLSNWDVLRLAQMVRPGMQVALNHGDRQMAAAATE